MSSVQLDPSLADEMVQKAARTCADMKFSGDVQGVFQAMQKGNCDLCGSMCDCLVKQVGVYLGKADKTVKAIYRYAPDFSTPRPVLGSEALPARKAGINLVVWVGRKSAALDALGATLESLLAESRRKFACQKAAAACYVMDIQMVDDREVQENRAAAQVVNNLFLHSIQVWKRTEFIQRPDNGKLSWSPREIRSLLESLDPETAPESDLFNLAAAIEKLSLQERQPLDGHLKAIKTALIRRLISDQPAYLEIARDWLTLFDLEVVNQHKIGFGKIGGKAAGQLLSARILHETLEEPLRSSIQVPETFYLGADLIYTFLAMNGLMRWSGQKYTPENKIRSDYPRIQEAFQAGDFPEEVLEDLQAMLGRIGRRPVIVRSSSLLEDALGASLAGKYETIFCPNQGTPQENLRALTQAIARIYASTLSPEALLYRKSKGLQEYDERMAIMIEEVQGEKFGRYLLPTAAGVAFSRNLYRWSPQIRREDGFVRLVWGMGTRAVERLGSDYPRLVALSHPTLYPADSCQSIRYHSQSYVDVIDLEANQYQTLPIRDVLAPDYPPLRYIAQIDGDGFLTTPKSRVMQADIPQLVITFDEFLRQTEFAASMKTILHTLEKHYHAPVDVEFTVQILNTEDPPPEIRIWLLQCRPQPALSMDKDVQVPEDLPRNRVILSTRFMVPQGRAANIRHVLFISPQEYSRLPSPAAHQELRAAIAHLNILLGAKTFMCVAHGRWGTSSEDLGIFVAYSDIYNAAALVELSGWGSGLAPDASVGTDFFQDLLEANIYPLVVCLDEKDTTFNWDFFYRSANHVRDYLKVSDEVEACLHLIEVNSFAKDCHLELVMDGDQGQAVAYIKSDAH